MRRSRRPRIGSVTGTANLTPVNGFTSGLTLTLYCPDLPSSPTCEVNFKNLTGTRGLVVFHRGAGGGAMWNSANDQDADLLTPLINAADGGYRLVQMRWPPPTWSGWMQSPLGHRAGITQTASRPATVVKWLHDNYKPAGGEFVLVGHSSGASAFAGAMCYYNADQYVDTIVLAAGPAQSHHYRGCAGVAGDEQHIYGTLSDLPDLAGGYAGDATGPCVLLNGNATDKNRWWHEALWGNGSKIVWENTRTAMIMGALDNGAAYPQGLLLRDKWDLYGHAYTFEELPATGHGTYLTNEGRVAIRDAVLNV